MDLVAPDRVSRDRWVDILSHLLGIMTSLGIQKDHEMYLRKKFKGADKSGNGRLTYKECKQVQSQSCKQANYNSRRTVIKADH